MKIGEMGVTMLVMDKVNPMLAWVGKEHYSEVTEYC